MVCWDYLIGIQEIFTTYIMGNVSVPWCLMGIYICRATVPAFNFLKMLTGWKPILKNLIQWPSRLVLLIGYSQNAAVFMKIKTVFQLTTHEVLFWSSRSAALDKWEITWSTSTSNLYWMHLFVRPWTILLQFFFFLTIVNVERGNNFSFVSAILLCYP